jgi:hypothetical protein
MDPLAPPSVDLLSSLPEHLQDEILMRLDLRDAVRTSALSRAWCRRWETLPGLALSFPDGTPPSVVDRVLLRYAGPSVSRFVSYVNGDASASHVDDWLIALSRRSVESISIVYEYGGNLTLHSSIFSCDRLVSLTLEWCSIPPLPQRGGFAGFPVLKELYLTSVEFADNGESQLRAIIRASPMLRVLMLERVYANDIDCVIEAPNLHTLGLISYSEWRFGDLPRLQYASINVLAYLQGGRAGFVEFLAGVSQVEELIFNLPVHFLIVPMY